MNWLRVYKTQDVDTCYDEGELGLVGWDGDGMGKARQKLKKDAEKKLYNRVRVEIWYRRDGREARTELKK